MLLRCKNLRIDQDGDPLLEGFDLEADATSLALVGDFHPLFAALKGDARVVSGSFEIAGVRAREAVLGGQVGLALFEPRRAAHWTVLDLLHKSGVLAGFSGAGAQARAQAVLGRLRLQGLGVRRLSSLAPVEHTAVQLALALLTEPAVIALELPFRSRSSSEIDWLWSLLGVAADQRRFIVSFDEAMLENRRLIGHFQCMALRHGSRAPLVGDPTDLLRPDGYLVSVTRRGARLARALQDLGCRVQPESLDDEKPEQLLVSGDDLDLAALVARAAVKDEVPVIELVPLPGRRPTVVA